MNNLLFSSIITLEDFFNNPSWPLSEHDLEQSPCCPIIDVGKFETMGKTFYSCRIHPGAWSIDLTGIEHHCRYQEPEKHKAELLEMLSTTKRIKRAQISIFLKSKIEEEKLLP